MPIDVGAILDAAKTRGIVGTGVLVIDGIAVAVIRSFSYDSSVKLHEQTVGPRNASTYNRRVAEGDVSLKVDYGDVLGNIHLFTWNAATIPSDGVLPTHTASYYGFQGLVIYFPYCNVIPGHLKMSDAGLGSGNLEIRSTNNAMPKMYYTSDAIVVTVPAGTITTVEVDGTLVVDGTL